jgi:steroid delta-isomerase-like uncharacterized protein
MKIQTMVAATLCLVLAASCNKKDKDKPSGTTGSGAMTKPTEGSAPAPAPPEPPKPAPRTGKDLAQGFLDCAALLDAARWDDFGKQCVAASFVGHHVDDEDVPRDRLMTMFTGMKAAFPDLKFRPQLVLVNGRSIISVNLLAGTNDGPLKSPMGELPATKKKLGVLLYERFAIDDENKTAEQWAYSDPATLLGQLGHLPKGAPPVRPAMDKGIVEAPVIVVAADDDKEQANLAVVKQQNDAFNGKKAGDVLALFSDDAIESDQAAPADSRGKKELEKGLQMFWKGFPDVKIDVPNLWAAGDYVAVEGTFTGTNTGPMGKMPKTGKQVTLHYAEVFKLKDGKITETWRFWNGVAMARQLGLIPEPPKGAGP